MAIPERRAGAPRRMFDSEDKFTKWLMDQPEPRDLDDQIGPYGGLEIVIDTAWLPRKLGVGRTVVGRKDVDCHRRGGLRRDGRVFMPRRTAQYFFGERNMERSSVMLVKLKDGVTTIDATAKIKRLAIADHKLGFVEVVPLRQYRVMLEDVRGDVSLRRSVNVIALIIAFRS